MYQQPNIEALRAQARQVALPDVRSNITTFSVLGFRVLPATATPLREAALAFVRLLARDVSTLFPLTTAEKARLAKLNKLTESQRSGAETAELLQLSRRHAAAAEPGVHNLSSESIRSLKAQIAKLPPSLRSDDGSAIFARLRAETRPLLAAAISEGTISFREIYQYLTGETLSSR